MKIAITFQGKTTTIEDLARDHGLSRGTLYHRWTKEGRPSCIPETLLARPVHSGGRRRSRLDGPMKTYRTVLAYSDPDFLPHIPLGDLAHLSATENTGAARNTCEF